MNSTKPELKECPFCNNIPHVCGTDEGPWKGFSIQCSCGASIGYNLDRDACPNYQFETEQEAINAWNTRAGGSR